MAYSQKQTFEYPAHNDVPAAIKKVLKESGQKKLYWVSHSGGGHLALMHLARKPEYQEKFAGLVTLGAQATDGAMGFKYKTRALFLWGLTRLFGQFPEAIATATVGTEGEPTRLLAQWSKWNIKKKWQGGDGFDYMSGLSTLTVPALMLAGSKDDIAPTTGCKKFFDAMGSDDKSWLVFSQANGHSKDFTHGQLIRGSAAQQDVYPHISDWITKRNSQS